jgi:tetratricopeptide (TPR) repeat protein
MRKLITAVILIVFYSHPLSACLNYYHVSEHGVHGNGGVDNLAYFYRFHDEKDLKKACREFQKTKWQHKEYYFHSHYSNYGANLLKLGFYKEGLNIFRYLVQQKSEEYNVIANLAVAYELNGQTDSALIWLRKALVIRPDSHHNSEWIHLAILEAKIQEAKEPGWLQTHPVIPDQQLTGKTQAQLINSFSYQLHERLPFTAAPDLAVSKLLEQFGDILMGISVSEAWNLYAMAQVFSPAGSEALQAKVKKAQVLTEKYSKEIPKGPGVSHWATAASVQKLVDTYKAHQPLKSTSIKPVLYH